MDDRRLAALLRTFVPDGRLIRLPAKRARRRLVLEHLAQAFEPGRPERACERPSNTAPSPSLRGAGVPEREVDAVLRAWCAGGEVDHVSELASEPSKSTVRRYLVDEGLLSRDHNVYWRSGGWVDVLGVRA